MTEDRCKCGREIPASIVKRLLKDKHIRGECRACKRTISGLSIRDARIKAGAAPETLARTTDPSTSKEAAEEVAKRLTDARRYAYEAVVAQPGCTANELANQADDLDTRRIGRRLNELEKAGVVRRGPVRRCRISGRKGATWEPVL